MIVGATRVIDEKTGFHKKDGKGRYLWDMPEPPAIAEHKVRTKELMQFGDKVIRVPQTKKVEVPVYRGYSLRFINYIRSQRALMLRERAKSQAEVEQELNETEENKDGKVD